MQLPETQLHVDANFYVKVVNHALCEKLYKCPLNHNIIYMTLYYVQLQTNLTIHFLYIIHSDFKVH